MTAKKHPVSQFRRDIAALIAEVEDCMRSTPSSRDREFDFQREAFRERCRQAKRLAQRLAADNRSEWSLRSGDAHRIQESLKLSLTYFRGRPIA